MLILPGCNASETKSVLQIKTFSSITLWKGAVTDAEATVLGWTEESTNIHFRSVFFRKINSSIKKVHSCHMLKEAHSPSFPQRQWGQIFSGSFLVHKYVDDRLYPRQHLNVKASICTSTYFTLTVLFSWMLTCRFFFYCSSSLNWIIDLWK